VDVGVYDYRSGHRGLGRQTGKFEFWLHQLAGHLRDVAAEYTDIVLVGHSLGGLLIEAVAKDYFETRALERQEGSGSLAALIVIASPRAGSGWAVPIGQLLMPELVVLRRLNQRSADVDEFFATYVERHNVAGTRPGIFDLPVYAALGGGDKLVSQFSAAFGVPREQRLYLEAGHLSIAKPEGTKC
jgi:pimeloyl-ACP methyl ester carboxylesterase